MNLMPPSPVADFLGAHQGKVVRYDLEGGHQIEMAVTQVQREPWTLIGWSSVGSDGRIVGIRWYEIEFRRVVAFSVYESTP